MRDEIIEKQKAHETAGFISVHILSSFKSICTSLNGNK